MINKKKDQNMTSSKRSVMTKKVKKSKEKRVTERGEGCFENSLKYLVDADSLCGPWFACLTMGVLLD